MHGGGRGGIREHGRPASTTADRGAQSCAVEAESRRRGATEFEGPLVAGGMRRLPARAGRPQASGKAGRLFGAMRQIRPFAGTGEFAAWRNAASPHMTPNAGGLETPRGVPGRKMPPPGARAVTD